MAPDHDPDRTPMDRRSFLVGASLAILGAARGPSSVAADERAEFLSACRRPDGHYALALLTRGGRIVREIPLSARGHDIAVHNPTGLAVAFARRPGFFAVAFDLAGSREPRVFEPEPDRHFYGHGAFTADGRLLYTSEHDIPTGHGLIGIYDVEAGFKRVGEFRSHGIGPHEAILLGDGRTLAVANGGIATDPATGRETIDIAGMIPSLAFIDVETGDLKAQHMLPPELSRLSIRHIVADARGEVWFGGQWQAGIESAPGLIGRASMDKPITLAGQGAALGVALKGYIGSVAMSRDGRRLAASAPRAGRVIYIDTETGGLAAQTMIADGCGLAAVEEDVFALSSGRGMLRLEHPGQPALSIATVEGTELDNHLRQIG